MKPSQERAGVFQENELAGVDGAREPTRDREEDELAAEGEPATEEEPTTEDEELGDDERTPDVVEEIIGYDVLGAVSSHSVSPTGDRRPKPAANESGSDQMYEGEPSQTPEELAAELLIEMTEAPPVTESPEQRRTAVK